ncbi:hypothetical protein VTJ04DRAFT_1671 [Mycothermus thermophilus]|uniref:uncharacterized protein n=1 Tax=Humicola insolens TaxID=85995 RepID=UPI003742D59B
MPKPGGSPMSSIEDRHHRNHRNHRTDHRAQHTAKHHSTFGSTWLNCAARNTSFPTAGLPISLVHPLLPAPGIPHLELSATHYARTPCLRVCVIVAQIPEPTRTAFGVIITHLTSRPDACRRGAQPRSVVDVLLEPRLAYVARPDQPPPSPPA